MGKFYTDEDWRGSVSPVYQEAYARNQALVDWDKESGYEPSDRLGNGFFGDLADSFQAGLANGVSGILSEYQANINNNNAQVLQSIGEKYGTDSAQYQAAQQNIANSSMNGWLQNNIDYLGKVQRRNVSLAPKPEASLSTDYILNPNGFIDDAAAITGGMIPSLAAAAGVELATRGSGSAAAASLLANGFRAAKALRALDAVASGGGKVAGALKTAGSVASKIMPNPAGVLTGAAVDNYTNAGSVYQQALQNGMSTEDAFNASEQAYNEGWSPSLGSFAIERAGIAGKGLSSLMRGASRLAGGVADAVATTGGGMVRGALKTAGRVGADIGINAASEGFTEAWQQNVSDRALGLEGADQVRVQDPTTWTDSMNQAFAQGAVGGGLFSGVGKAISGVQSIMPGSTPDVPAVAQQPEQVNTDPDNMIVDTPEVQNTVANVGGTQENIENSFRVQDEMNARMAQVDEQMAEVQNQQNPNIVVSDDIEIEPTTEQAIPNQEGSSVNMGQAEVPTSDHVNLQKAVEATSRAFVSDKEQQDAIANVVNIVNTIPDEELASMKVTAKTAQQLALDNNPNLNTSRKVTSIGKVLYDGLKSKQNALTSRQADVQTAQAQENAQETRPVAQEQPAKVETTKEQQEAKPDTKLNETPVAESVNKKFAESLTDNPQEQQMIVDGIRKAVYSRNKDLQDGKSLHKTTQTKSYLNEVGLTKDRIGDKNQDAIAQHINAMTERVNQEGANNLKDVNERKAMKTALSEQVMTTSQMNTTLREAGNLKNQAKVAMELAKGGNKAAFTNTKFYKRLAADNATHNMKTLKKALDTVVYNKENPTQNPTRANEQVEAKVEQQKVEAQPKEATKPSVPKEQPVVENMDLNKDSKSSLGTNTKAEEVSPKKPNSTGTKSTKKANTAKKVAPKKVIKTKEEDTAIAKQVTSSKELVKAVVENEKPTKAKAKSVEIKAEPKKEIVSKVKEATPEEKEFEDYLKTLSPRERRQAILDREEQQRKEAFLKKEALESELSVKEAKDEILSKLSDTEKADTNKAYFDNIIKEYGYKYRMSDERKANLAKLILDNQEELKDFVGERKLKSMVAFANDNAGLEINSYSTKGGSVVDYTDQDIDRASELVDTLGTDSSTIVRGAAFMAGRMGDQTPVVNAYIKKAMDNTGLSVTADNMVAGVNGWFNPMTNEIKVAFDGDSSSLLHETVHAAFDHIYDHTGGHLEGRLGGVFRNLTERLGQYASSTHGLFNRANESGKTYINVVSGELAQGELGTYRGRRGNNSLRTSRSLASGQTSQNEPKVGSKNGQSSVDELGKKGLWDYLRQDQLQSLASQTNLEYVGRAETHAKDIEERFNKAWEDNNYDNVMDALWDAADHMQAILDSSESTPSKLMAAGSFVNMVSRMESTYEGASDIVYNHHVMQELMSYGSDFMLSPKELATVFNAAMDSIDNGSAKTTRTREMIMDRYKNIADTDKPILRSNGINADWTKAMINGIKSNKQLRKGYEKFIENSALSIESTSTQRYEQKGNSRLASLQRIFDSPWSFIRQVAGNKFDRYYVEMVRAQADARALESKFNVALNKAFENVGKKGIKKFNEILTHVDNQGREDFQPTNLRDIDDPRTILGSVILGPKDEIQEFESEQGAKVFAKNMEKAGKFVLRDYTGDTERVLVFNEKPVMYKNLSEASQKAAQDTVALYNQKYGQGYGEAYRDWRNVMDTIQYEQYKASTKVGTDAPKYKWGYVPHIHKPYLVVRRMELTNSRGEKYYQYKAINSFHSNKDAISYIQEMRKAQPNATFAYGKRFERTDKPVPEEFRQTEFIDDLSEMFNDVYIDESEKDATSAAEHRYRLYPQTKKFVDTMLTNGKEYTAEELINVMENKEALEAAGINYNALQQEFSAWGRKDLLDSKDKFSAKDISTYLGLSGNVKLMRNKFSIAREGAEGFSKDHIQNSYEYANYAAHFIPRSQAIAKMSKMYNNDFEKAFGDAPSSDVEEALKASIDNFRGVPNKFDQKMDQIVTELPYVGKLIKTYAGDRAASNAMKTMLQLVAFSKLGMSIATGLAQFSAGLNTLAIHGYNKTSKAAWEWAAKDAIKYRNAQEKAKWKGGMVEDYYKPETEKDKEYGELLRVVRAREENLGFENDFQRGNNSITSWKIGNLKIGAAMDSAMYAFDIGDKIPRYATAIVAYEKALKDGATKEEAQNNAIREMREYIFDMTNIDEQGMFQYGGSLGKMLLQFKKYPAKQLSFILHNILKTPTPREKYTNETQEHYDMYLERLGKETKLRIARFFIPYLALGGLFIAPAGGAADELSKLFMDKGIKDHLKDYLYKWAGNDKLKQQLAVAMMYGLPSMAGVNFSSKISLEDAIPTEGKQLLGPTISTAIALQKVWAADGPIENKIPLWIKAISPTIGNYITAAMGVKLKQSTAEEVRDYSSAERFAKLFGFTPIKDTVGYDVEKIIKETKKAHNAQIKELTERAKGGDQEAIQKLKTEYGKKVRKPSKKQLKEQEENAKLDDVQKTIKKASQAKGSANKAYTKELEDYNSFLE